jgi:hypothetical protein
MGDYIEPRGNVGPGINFMPRAAGVCRNSGQRFLYRSISRQVSPYTTRLDLGDTGKFASPCNQGETLGPEISLGSIDQCRD